MRIKNIGSASIQNNYNNKIKYSIQQDYNNKIISFFEGNTELNPYQDFQINFILKS